ncbi:MAG: sensor histidine kinase [Acidobacteriaceae bacterium]|nr:sensor histidine kinase [Acidobacteriaceae bacterium]
MEESIDSDLTHESLIHDLNNVFETITEIAEMLSTDTHWQPMAATLTRSVARGKRLLGAIPDRTPDLASVLEDAIQSVTDYCIVARKPRMRFVRQVPSNVRLPGSGKDWERVFANLFLNAAQIVETPGRIDITAQKTEESLAIVVSDNGPGIPADLLPRMFSPNVSTKTNSGARSGLGLHIVASIVKRYSGRVTAGNREPGTGAVFTITLPTA